MPPEPGPTSERLEALRERWEADRGSRVFLQLADEYRRLGRTVEAARVLEEGLEANPNHPAAQVALGRCHLELGRPGEAAALLERVTESDPTQMVAYRLLVDAYLGQGRPEEARQRLRIYSLLNDSDPEIAELRRRIGELDRRSDEATGEPAPAPAAGGAPEEEPAETWWLDEPAEEPADEPAAAIPAAIPGGAPAGLDSGAGADGEPFPGLAEPGARRRYLEALAAGGLFEVEPEPEPEPGLEELPAAGAEVFDLGSPPAAPVPDLASLLGPAEAAALEPGARPTVTLGRLYLRQGHLREAEEIFREVLAREPGNAEARAHLEALAEPAGSPPPPPPVSAPAEPPPALAASELLRGFDGRGRGEGLTERKRYVLERYLERLRGRTPRDVH